MGLRSCSAMGRFRHILRTSPSAFTSEAVASAAGSWRNRYELRVANELTFSAQTHPLASTRRFRTFGCRGFACTRSIKLVRIDPSLTADLGSPPSVRSLARRRDYRVLGLGRSVRVDPASKAGYGSVLCGVSTGTSAMALIGTSTGQATCIQERGVRLSPTVRTQGPGTRVPRRW